MVKLLLRFLASHSVETRAYVFGPSWGDGLVDDSKGCGVVYSYWRRWLQMAHCDERVAGGDGFAKIYI